MKKIIIILTLIFMPFSVMAFSDVSEGGEFYDAVTYVQSQGIVNGYEDGRFRPYNEINRAEFTKIIMEATFGKSVIDDCLAKYIPEEWRYVFFPDVPRDAWFAKYICAAKTEGIIDGYPDGTFQPAQNISFVEAAKIIVASFSWEVIEDEVWYKPYVDALADRNAIPLRITAFPQPLIRGEMAEMIYRIKAEDSSKESQSYNSISGREEEDEGISMDITEIESLDFTFEADIADVSGGNALGTAKVMFHEGKTHLYVLFQDLPRPGDDAYYACWLGKEGSDEIIATGIVGQVEDKVVNMYMAEGDITDFNTFFVTLESDEESEQLGKVIMEGQFLSL